MLYLFLDRRGDYYLYKVGYTADDTKKRLAQYQITSVFMEEVSTREGGEYEENIIHRYLHTLSNIDFIKNEWYYVRSWDERIKEAFELPFEVMKVRLWNTRKEFVPDCSTSNNIRLQNELYDSYDVTGQARYENISDAKKLPIEAISTSPIKELLLVYRETKEFEVRLRAYCEFREKHPELSAEVENSIYIPSKFTEYYKNPGPDRCRAKSYHESLIKNEIGFSALKDDVGNDIYNAFKDIDKITKREAKAIIQEIYIKHNLSKKAKATDLETYFDCKYTSIYKDKKPVAGIKLFVKGTIIQ